MISEAIAARLPVIGLTPQTHKFTPQEAEYRQGLMARNWTRSLMIHDLTLDHLDRALSELEPMRENHVDVLAAQLRDRLPQLFASS